MPPAKKTVIPSPPPEPEGLLKVGAIVNLVSGGRTLTDYEVLAFDARLVKFRGSVLNAPQTELVLIPWEKIEAIGLKNER
jgi:hypothetical protein